MTEMKINYKYTMKMTTKKMQKIQINKEIKKKGDYVGVE